MRSRIEAIGETCRKSLAGSGITIKKDQSIAIGVGSRGIANLAEIVSSAVEWVNQCGGRPFIVPAMGSHGGATAEGQVKVLQSYGISEASVGCPIISSMDTVVIPNDDPGLKPAIFMDRHAWESDGVIVINRIKPHTDFHGDYESGLMKMSVIGLGKESQAKEMHQFGVHGLKVLTPMAAKHILNTGKIIGGIGIVENAYDETAHIEAIPGHHIPHREQELLKMARGNMPSLPLDSLDILHVDSLGKNISGTGMDTNVIGRIYIPGQPDPESPNIHTIIVSDLTRESGGNSTGMGLADIVTRKFQSHINNDVTRMNIITSGFLLRAKLPFVAESEFEAWSVALRASGCIDPSSARIIRIADTLHLSDMWVSEAALHSLRGDADVEILGPVESLFSQSGDLAELIPSN